MYKRQVIRYPFVALVTTVKSCAETEAVVVLREPKGIAAAVTPLTFTLSPLTDPEFTGATVKVNNGSTVALTAMEFVSRTANATVTESITVLPASEYVVIRA